MLRLTLFAIVASSTVALGCGQPGSPTNGCIPMEPSRDEPVYEVSDRTQSMSSDYGREIESGRLRERTNMALDAMIRFAAFKLRLKGYPQTADKIIKEWEGQWSGYIERVGRDIGDHKPLSEWIAQKYAVIELILGEDLCHALRLDDIKIINYGIPVVFSCVDNVGEVEYGKHFIPFSGTVIYWTSFFACVGGTWGTGFLWCAPISWGCEFLTEKFVAPKLNHTVWNWSCN